MEVEENKKSEVVKTITLTKEITGHNGKINKLELREPSGKIVMRRGLPYATIVIPGNEEEGEPDKIEIKQNPKMMAEYAAEMSGVDTLVLEQMKVADIVSLNQAIIEITSPAGNSETS